MFFRSGSKVEIGMLRNRASRTRREDPDHIVAESRSGWQAEQAPQPAFDMRPVIGSAGVGGSNIADRRVVQFLADMNLVLCVPGAGSAAESIVAITVSVPVKVITVTSRET